MNIAFWNDRKRKRKNPRLEFEIKDDETYIFYPKLQDKKPFSKFKKGKVYEIKISDLKELKEIAGYQEFCLPDKLLKFTKYKLCTKYDDMMLLLDKKIDFFKHLFDYQKSGVCHIIKNFQGKGLIGDEMGLGKTLQGLCLYAYYNPKNLLVVCPAYLRYTWQHEINKWMDRDCQVITKGKDEINGDITIVSYELAAKKVKELDMFTMVICDESHYLKSHKTKRTKCLTPFLKKRQLLLLLTGTPALNRPSELFPQCHIIRPDVFKNFKEYTKRYCDGKIHPAGYYDFSGSSNKNELNWITKKLVMIRRLKRDVLTELPIKQRSEIYLKLTNKDTKPLKPLFKRWIQLNNEIPRMVPGSEALSKAAFERKVLITELYRKSSAAKVMAVKKVIKDMASQGLKFIVFCYHKAFMNEMEEACDAVEYIRIDGDTPVKKRQQYVDEFQNGEVQVAILSLLAASTGFTLTATSLLVFAELSFVPGIMLQAEDRIHRIGQTQSCDIRYIIGEGTLDDYIFRMIRRKLDTLDSVLDNRTDRNFI